LEPKVPTLIVLGHVTPCAAFSGSFTHLSFHREEPTLTHIGDPLINADIAAEQEEPPQAGDDLAMDLMMFGGEGAGVGEGAEGDLHPQNQGNAENEPPLQQQEPPAGVGWTMEKLIKLKNEGVEQLEISCQRMEDARSVIQNIRRHPTTTRGLFPRVLCHVFEEVETIDEAVDHAGDSHEGGGMSPSLLFDEHSDDAAEPPQNQGVVDHGAVGYVLEENIIAACRVLLEEGFINRLVKLGVMGLCLDAYATGDIAITNWWHSGYQCRNLTLEEDYITAGMVRQLCQLGLSMNNRCSYGSQVPMHLIRMGGTHTAIEAMQSPMCHPCADSQGLSVLHVAIMELTDDQLFPFTEVLLQNDQLQWGWQLEDQCGRNILHMLVRRCQTSNIVSERKGHRSNVLTLTLTLTLIGGKDTDPMF